MTRAFLCVGLAVLAVSVVACGGGTPQAVTPTRAAAEDDQRQRAELIAGWVRDGYFREVKPDGKAVRVIVTAKFLALDFDEKQTMVSVVAAHHYGTPRGENVRPGEDVYVDDVRTGQAVGLYGTSGLVLN